MKPKNPEFYMVVPVGTESRALQELESWSGFFRGADLRPSTDVAEDLQTHKGGISFTAPLGWGLQTHYWLKIPVRILVRLNHFFADEFYQLERGFEQTPLTQWLSPHVPLEFKIEAQQSKLGQEKRIASIAEKVFAKKFKINNVKNPSPQTQRVYIRAVSNQWQVSLDATGEPLYKRGWAPLKGEAPLRENLAALMVQELITEKSLGDLAKIKLVDPFAGSGTLLWEALMRFQPNGQRRFAFQEWLNAPQYLKLSGFLNNDKLPRNSGFAEYIAKDNDPKMIQILTEHRDALKALSVSTNIEIQTQNFWDSESISPLNPENKVSKSLLNWVLTNPPYGQRLPWSNTEKANWLVHLAGQLDPERIGFVYPENLLRGLKIPNQYHVKSKFGFSHGGTDVEFIVIEKIHDRKSHFQSSESI